MIRVFFIFFLLSLNITNSQAQLMDDFSDGNFDSNPTWSGDVNSFTVNEAFQLQLNASEAGNAVLSIPVDIPDSTLWELYTLLDFSPSTSNLARIYLQSTQEDLSSGNGYFLEIGESGSTDAIRVFKFNGSDNTLIASGREGAVASEPVELRLLISRTNTGQWQLKVSYDGSENYSETISFEDDSYLGGNQYFGFGCKFTDSRKGKFFFDDIKISPLLPDTDAPLLIEAKPISANQLDLIFNEALQASAANTASNYSINNGIGQVQAAQLDMDNPSLVHLTTSSSFQNNQNYTVTTNQLTDVAGNVANELSANFSFVQTEAAEPFDILINEIMVDPTPTLGLPDVEFLELYNRSDKTIALNSLKISSGGTPQVLAEGFLQPKEYVIVCDDSNEALFNTYGKVVTVNSFPALTNSIDQILLENETGETIHRIEYNLFWYKDSKKVDGGWTLELINPENPCDGSIKNWSASEDLLGGTPGRANSILLEEADNIGAELLSIFPTSSTSLLLTFNEAVDPFTAEDVSNYTISNNIITSKASISGIRGNQVELDLAEALSPNVIYELSIGQSFTDCLGNPFDESQIIPFGLPESAEVNDVIINEILFNPFDPGFDFVELYNKSDKILNVGDFILGNSSNEESERIRSNYLLMPDSYVAISLSPSNLAANYSILNEKALLVNFLPAFNNDEGNVSLITTTSASPVILDAFDYKEDFHYALLDNLNGVSLERISPVSETQSSSNWQSASKAAGFATPGYENSQRIDPNAASSESLFTLENRTFSPNGDGDKDFLLISFKGDRSGYTSNIKIFDAQGRLVRSLTENEQLGTMANIKWDGITDRGTKARLGIYVIWIELFQLDGTISRFKETCVVAGNIR